MRILTVSQHYIYFFFFFNSDCVSWIYILLNVLHKNFKKHKVVSLGGQTDKSFYHSTKNEATGENVMIGIGERFLCSAGDLWATFHPAEGNLYPEQLSIAA